MSGHGGVGLDELSMDSGPLRGANHPSPHPVPPPSAAFVGSHTLFGRRLSSVALVPVRPIPDELSLPVNVRRAICRPRNQRDLEGQGVRQMQILPMASSARQVLDGRAKTSTWAARLGVVCAQRSGGRIGRPPCCGLCVR
jgi:hypothetical protein